MIVALIEPFIDHDIDGWSLPRVVSIGREICLGMSYLHTHGVLIILLMSMDSHSLPLGTAL